MLHGRVGGAWCHGGMDTLIVVVALAAVLLAGALGALLGVRIGRARSVASAACAANTSRWTLLGEKS